jgi:hypothetical protein
MATRRARPTKQTVGVCLILASLPLEVEGLEAKHRSGGSEEANEINLTDLCKGSVNLDDFDWNHISERSRRKEE